MRKLKPGPAQVASETAKRRTTVRKRQSEKTAKSEKTASGIRSAGFLRNLATIFKEDRSIVPSLSALADQESDARLQEILRDVAGRVRAGERLSAAFAAQSGWLEADAIAAIQQGESSGRLAENLVFLADEMAPESDGPEVTIFEVAEFARAFAALVGDEVSLVRALTDLEATQANPDFKRIIHDVNAQVQAGSTLSEAMSKYPHVFDEQYMNAVRAGEVNGNLDWTLRSLKDLDDIVTFDQAVQFLGTSKATLYRLLNEEKIKGLRVGRQWRFRKADLRAYLEKKPETVSANELEGIEEELKFFDSLVKEHQDDADTPESSADPNETDAEHMVVQLVNRILLLAIESGASDIHLETARLEGQVVLLLRHRIDGVLHEIRRLPEKLSKPLFNRLKVMGDMSIEERALPQDGRTHLKVKDKNFDLRTNWIPTAYGGSLVMRIMDQSHNLLSFEQIGLQVDDDKRLRDWLNRPYGLIVNAGTSASGKTTTLYAAMHLKVAPEIKTITIEDPVEYALPYATQVYAAAKAGLTIATATRAFLRQDPDIILIAELRDGEVAQLAHTASLTGHLILSSLPARSAGEATRRLIDMGVQPFVVGSALIGTMAQRLARRICPHCAEPYEPRKLLMEQLRRSAAEGGYQIPKQATFQRGRGCEKCRGAGYRGRIGLFEMLEMNERISDGILNGASAEELEKIAIADGMTTLAADGARKAVEGITTVEEVLRVLFIGAQH